MTGTLVRTASTVIVAILLVTLSVAAPRVLQRPKRATAPRVQQYATSKGAVRVAQRPGSSSPRPRATATVTPGRRTTTTPAPRRTTRTARRRSRSGRQPGFERRGAFGPYALQSKEKLLYTLQKYPSFRRNLARHFGVSEAELLTYIDKNVVLKALPTARSTRVFGVTPGGRIFAVNQRLPKGALVFSLPDGTAILKEICGNPVLAYLPPTPGSTTPVAQMIPAQLLTTTFPATLVAGTVPPPGALPFASAVVPVVATTAFAPELIAAAPGVVTGVHPMMPSQVGGAGGGGGGFFPYPLAALAGLAFIGGGDGGRVPKGTPTPIPEPATNFAMAAGLLMMGAAYRVSRRRKLTLTAPRRFA